MTRYAVIGVTHDNWPAVLDAFESLGYGSYLVINTIVYAPHISILHPSTIVGWNNSAFADFREQVHMIKTYYPDMQRVTTARFLAEPTKYIPRYTA